MFGKNYYVETSLSRDVKLNYILFAKTLIQLTKCLRKQLFVFTLLKFANLIWYYVQVLNIFIVYDYKQLKWSNN